MTNVKLTLETVHATKISDLRDLFEFDLDFNGDNGDEFMSEKAKKGGFENDLDYAMELAEKETSLVSAFNIIWSHFINTSGEYYDTKEYKHFFLSGVNGMIFSIAVATKN